MNKRKDGGTAFPTPYPGGAAPGMSLRDWFAGQALAGFLAGSPDADCGPKGYAHDAYQIADAMLEARGKADE